MSAGHANPLRVLRLHCDLGHPSEKPLPVEFSETMERSLRYYKELREISIEVVGLNASNLDWLSTAAALPGSHKDSHLRPNTNPIPLFEVSSGFV